MELQFTLSSKYWQKQVVEPEKEGEFDDFINDDVSENGAEAYSQTSHSNPDNYEIGADDEAAFAEFDDPSFDELTGEPEPEDPAEATDHLSLIHI